MTKKAPMDKAQVAELLEDISVFLEILGENPFKCRAYAAAARAVEALPGDLVEMVSSKELLNVKGIGKSIFEHIETLVNTGSLPYYEELEARIPEGLLELLRIPGMGPKKVKAVHEKLGISNIGELEYACLENRLVELDGFGQKSQAKILSGIENLKKYRERHLYNFALEQALPIYDVISKHPDVIRHLLTGSLRRYRETVKDIDIVASARKSKDVMKRFTSLPEVESVIAQGETKSSIMLYSGINADLRIVSDKEFPYATHHFTGSKEHNTQMRSRAKKMGLKMNEYGLFRGTKLIPCKNEQEIFKKLGLDYIPPELREGLGEIEAAEANMLPRLLEEKEIKGLFHVHTNYSDGSATLEEMADAAKAMGFEYLGIADHSQSAAYAGGLKPEAVKRQKKEIEELNKKMKNFKLIHGIESDILPNGSLDYDPGILALFDFIVASVHSGFGLSEAEMTKRIIKAVANPFTTMLGHPTGRLLLAREGYRVNLNAVIDAAAEHNVVIELNANPHRLDLDWRFLKVAKEKGVKIAICPDAHHPEGLKDFRYGLGIARKGWLEKNDVINTMNTETVLKFFKSSRKK
jgi:DNA polymerase (family 10)